MIHGPFQTQTLALGAILAGHRVMACEWDGVQAFAKRTSRMRVGEKMMLAMFAPFGRWLLAPAVRFQPVARKDDPAPFEVQRLKELQDAGVRVPRLLASTDSAFVMEAVGEPLDRVLSAEPAADARRRWLLAAADDLAAFHAAGHWHGAAQVRNVAVSANGFARFDFDRDIDRHFPLVMLQALDAGLFLSSLTGIEDTEGVQLVARRYFASAPAEVAALIRRCRRSIGALVRLGLFRRLARKEWTRMKVLHVALEAAAPPVNPPRSSTP